MKKIIFSVVIAGGAIFSIGVNAKLDKIQKPTVTSHNRQQNTMSPERMLMVQNFVNAMRPVVRFHFTNNWNAQEIGATASYNITVDGNSINITRTPATPDLPATANALTTAVNTVLGYVLQIAGLPGPENLTAAFNNGTLTITPVTLQDFSFSDDEEEVQGSDQDENSDNDQDSNELLVDDDGSED